MEASAKLTTLLNLRLTLQGRLLQLLSIMLHVWRQSAAEAWASCRCR